MITVAVSKGKGVRKKSGQRAAKQGTATARGAEHPHLERLRALVEILEGSSLAELAYEDADIVVRLSRQGAPVREAPAGAPSAPLHPPPLLVEARAEAPAARDDKNVHVVRSPFVGTFYRAPSPDAAAFTDVGQDVVRGQTLCIVEAMKLMNEIESEVSGTVVAALVENGQTVQYGDPLFEIALRK